MDLTKRVEVYSNFNGVVVIADKEVGTRRVWQNKGDMKRFNLEDLEALSYNNGVRKMLENGTIVIKDREVREYLDLPVEDVFEITKKDAPKILEQTFAELKEVLEKSPKQVRILLAETAVEKEIRDWDKMQLLTDHAGFSVQERILERKKKQSAKS